MFTKNNASKSLIDAVSSVIEKKPVVEEKTQPQVISEEQVSEVAPPGFEGTVKAMKKYKKIDNPFALAWSMKNKGYKSHKKADGSPKNEEVEQIDELKKSTLGSYIKKASKDTAVHGFAIGDSIANKKWATGAKAGDMAAKRISGIAKATDKLTKEESETVDEALKGDQHKIDKNKNNKIDAQDFKILRKEDIESVDEALKGNQHEIDKNHNKKIDAQDFRILRAKMKKEEVETVDEAMSPLEIARARENGGTGGLGANPHHNDLHRPAKAAPSYIKQQLKARQAKGGVAGPKGRLPEHAVSEETFEEGWDDMVKAAKDSVKSGPKPSGGSGVKQGTRYGGSKQKDEPEEKKKN
jgi:hypothetical protein